MRVDAIDDEFVKYLFQLVEEEPEDVEDDPFHYPVIRMLVCLQIFTGLFQHRLTFYQLVLNEQYMLHPPTTTPTHKSIEDGPTNKVIKILCYHGTTYRTFGENIILLINRESGFLRLVVHHTL